MIPRFAKLSAVLFIFLPVLVFAQTPTVADLQALVQQLQEQVKLLQTQVITLQAQLEVSQKEQTEIKKEIRTVKEEVRLTKSLERGTTGEEVRRLQEFLRQFPDIYPEGLVTGYFGARTEAAIKKFQEKHQIENVGAVGPKTLLKINELMTTGAGRSGGIPPGLLIAPGIQAKFATTTEPIATTTPPTATTTPRVATTTLATTTLAISTTTSGISTTSTPYISPVTTVTSPSTSPSASLSATTTTATTTSAVTSVVPVFSITSPASGVTWPRGDTYGITWSNTGLIVSNVRISLYVGGSYNQFIAVDVPNSGSYSWQIPSSMSTGLDYSVRVFNSAYPNNWGNSGLFGIIASSTPIATTTPTIATSTTTATSTTAATSTTTNAPSITVTYPNGGEVWEYGYNRTLQYTFNGVSRVGLKLLKGGQIVHETTTPKTAGALGGGESLDFSWNNTNAAVIGSGSDYKMRVFDWDNPAVYDDSNAYFTLLPADLAPPIISSLTVSSITANSAVITWTTDEPATSEVNYGTPSNWKLTPVDHTRITSHVVVLTDLTSSAVYGYRVMSTDGLGNTAQTPKYPAEYTFTTLSSGGSATTTSATAQVNIASILESLTSLLQNLQQALR